MEIEELDRGLKFLGWRFNIRLTSEDILMLEPVVQQAIDHEQNGSLTQDIVEELSLEAYGILSFQFINVQERADAISTVYYNSINLRPFLALIDEATLAFYHGYYTSSLALLFVTLESYLRAIAGWQPGMADINTWQLREAISRLPNEESANDAREIADVVYSRYDATLPPNFGFSRHGLLHGIRNSNKYDEMNCARIFQLYDILCEAEGTERTAWGDHLDMFRKRYDIYSACGLRTSEKSLLSIDYDHD